MKILGINISHDFSVCVYENEKITKYFMEERFIFQKNFRLEDSFKDKKNFVFSLFKEIDFKPDLVIYSSFGRIWNKVTDEELIQQLQEQLDNPPFYFNKKNHHIYHACSSFYFSNFSEAMGIVIDGGGACPDKIGYQEIQSIFYINKNKIIKLFQSLSNLRGLRISPDFNTLYNNYSNYDFLAFKDGVETIFSSLCLGGMNFIEACELTNMSGKYGELMGLSSYGYTDKKFNLNYDYVKIAKDTQEKTFNETCLIIEKAYNYKKINNFVLSGGYFLNCSNNFKYVKKYPHINFFVDPVPHDGGTAIGACIYYDKYK
jgi:predicted NodU family carbamoyl transferase